MGLGSSSSMLALTEIEATALDLLLAGDHPTLEVLRAQLALSSVASRTLTGVGFFTEFSVPADAPRPTVAPRACIGDVYAEVHGLTLPAGFLLWLTNGCLSQLECFIHDEAWPSDPRVLRAYYVTFGAKRGELVETPERNLALAVPNDQA